MKFHALTLAAALGTVAAIRMPASHDSAFDAAYVNYTPAIKELGCYATLTDTLYKYAYKVEDNTAKSCAKKCKYAWDDAFVIGLHASECYCGMTEVPPDNRRVDNRYCGLPCFSEKNSTSSSTSNITCGGVRMLDITGVKQQLFYTLISNDIGDKRIAIGSTTNYDKDYKTSAADTPGSSPSPSPTSAASTYGFSTAALIIAALTIMV